MSDELLCPICGKDRLHFIGELADCSHSTIEVIEYAIILRKQLDEWEEKEAACCPEDFGFDEVIKSLRKQLDESNRKLEQRIALEIDEHLKVVSLQEKLEDGLLLIYAMDCKQAPSLAVAEVCDTFLDKSGGLLGRIRQRFYARDGEIERIGGMNVQG